MEVMDLSDSRKSKGWEEGVGDREEIVV